MEDSSYSSYGGYASSRGNPPVGGYGSPVFSPAQLRYFQWNHERRSLRRLASAYLACVALHFVCIAVLQVVLEMVLFWVHPMPVVQQMVQQISPLLFYFGAILLPFSFYNRIAGKPPAPKLTNGVNVPVMLSATGISMGISLVGIILSTVLLSVFNMVGLGPPELALPETTGLFSQVMSFIGVVILPCIIEELIFRKAILGSLQPYGNWFAIFTSSLLFGIYHGNMGQLPYSFVLGLCMAYFVLKTQSVYTGMFIHFVNNLLSWGADLIGKNMTDAGFGMLMLGEGIMRLMFAIAGLIFLGAVRNVQWKMPRGRTLIQGEEAGKSYFGSFAMIVVLVIYGVQIMLSFS